MAATEAAADYYGPDSMSAAAYDFVEAFTRDTAAELAFYRELAEAARTPVLELGVGTGRLALPLAEAGHAVVGIDASEAMLAVARAKRAAAAPAAAERLRLVSGDMRAFDLGARFDLVLLPYRAFNHLLTAEDQRAGLACVRRHLAPGGRAVFDLHYPSFPDFLDEARFREGRRMVIAFPFSDKRLERVVERCAFDFAEQIMTVAITYAVLDGEGRTLRRRTEEYRLRWIGLPEMRLLLRENGLRIVAEHGDFARTRPAGVGDQLWIVEADADRGGRPARAFRALRRRAPPD